MSTVSLKLKDNERHIELNNAKLIDISSVTTSATIIPNNLYTSTISLYLEDEDAMSLEPFDSISYWHANNQWLTIMGPTGHYTNRCKVHECTLNFQKQRLYIKFYLNLDVKQIREWFI